MTTTASKAIAARLPFDEYVRVLQAAVEAKQSLSDYLILQLRAGEQLSQQRDQLAALQKEATKLRQEINQTREAHQHATDTLGKWQAHAQKMEAKEKEAQEQIITLSDTISEWKKHSTKLIAERDALNKQVIVSSEHRKAQEQRISQLTTTNTDITRTNDVLTDSTAKLTQDNAALTAANDTLQHQLALLQTDVAKIKKNAKAMYNALVKEHQSSKINFIPKPYWAILDQFINSLNTKP
jgi:chromosome segregation ATPase